LLRVVDEALEETKSIRQHFFRFSDFASEEDDSFIRYCNFYDIRKYGDRIKDDGKDVRVFVDTGTNNSRRYFFAKLKFDHGPMKFHILIVSGDKIRIETEVVWSA